MITTAIRYGAGVFAGVFIFAATALNAAEFEQNVDKSFPATPGGKLSIEADQGSIEINTDGTDHVQVKVFRLVKNGTKAQADELFANHEVTFQNEGNGISVASKRKKAQSGFSGFRQPYLEVRFQVSIPRKFDVGLKTAGGDIRVAELDGNAVTYTSSGSINLKPITGLVEAKNAGGDIFVAAAGGDAAVSTSSGSIKVEKAGGKIEAHNSGGNIHIAEAAGEVTASTSSGSITVQKAKGNVAVKNSGGNIHVDEAGGDVTAWTSSGSITLLAIQGGVEATDSGGDIRIESAGRSVSVRTSSGSIYVGQVKGNEVKAKNSGGNIEIGEVSGSVSAQTSSGWIRLKLAKGNVEAKDSGGDIYLGQVGGETMAGTSSGAIEIGSADGKVVAKNAGGDITVGAAGDLVNADTSSGQISVVYKTALKGESRLAVSGGGIKLALPKSAALDVDAKASGGEIATEGIAVEVEGKLKSGSLQGKVNGGGPKLILRASSGDIRLKGE